MVFLQRRARHDLDAIFLVARQNPKIGYNTPGRGMGKHCVARFERARAKAGNASKVTPKHRPAVPYAKLAPIVTVNVSSNPNTESLVTYRARYARVGEKGEQPVPRTSKVKK